MQLHSIEPRLFGVFRGVAIIFQDTRDVFLRGFARLFVILTSFESMRVAGRFGCAGRNWRIPAEEQGVHQSAHVPHLQDDQTAFFMNGTGDLLPAFNLLIAPDTRRSGPAKAFDADTSSLGDDEPCAGTLTVIRCHHVVGDGSGLGRSTAGQRGHEYAISGFERAHGEWLKQTFVHAGQILFAGATWPLS